MKNFKSYREATLPLAPLSLLIGANASGKSNAIEGLRFLSWPAGERRLNDWMGAVQAGDQQVRGTITGIPHQGTDRFGFVCKADLHLGVARALEQRLNASLCHQRVARGFAVGIELRFFDTGAMKTITPK